MKLLISVDEIANLFNNEMKDLERKYSFEPFEQYEIFEKVQSIIGATCVMLKDLEDSYQYDQKTLKSLKTIFHNRTNELILKSYCLTRTRTWPQGHQGDYKTLEVAYRNTPLSSGLGYFLDLYALNSPLGVAIRNRIQILENMLREALQGRQKINILNIGCGSCRELMGIAPDIKESRARITCIDDDSDALNFANSRLSYAMAGPNIAFRKYNALRMFDYETNMQEFGLQDVIYSIGVFDYLPDDFLTALLKSLYALLRENGKLIAAFKNSDFYDHTPYHWIMDWDGFKQRNESDFLNILGNSLIPPQNIKSFKDDSNIVTFYLINKI